MVNSIADSLMNTMEKCGAYRVYGEDIDKIVRTVLIQKDGKYVINRKFVGHDATYILRESGVQFAAIPCLSSPMSTAIIRLSRSRCSCRCSAWSA